MPPPTRAKRACVEAPMPKVSMVVVMTTRRMRKLRCLRRNQSEDASTRTPMSSMAQAHDGQAEHGAAERKATCRPAVEGVARRRWPYAAGSVGGGLHADVAGQAGERSRPAVKAKGTHGILDPGGRRPDRRIRRQPAPRRRWRRPCTAGAGRPWRRRRTCPAISRMRGVPSSSRFIAR